ncbi:MAG: WXG100 family type VII secretion target [Bacilli bacterium]|nr:WXG100 family type VII secretion target [Bacilli bacterium]
MEDIYMNYDLISKSSDELMSHADVILSDVKKMKELLNDLNDYWKASAATRFSFNTDEFLDTLNKFSRYYETLSSKMTNAHDLYNDFENYFMSKSI